MTQTSAILAALESGRVLTPLDALREFGCMRLGARIYDLEQQGHKINRRLVRRGEAMIAEYWIEQRPARPLIEKAKIERERMGT